MSSVEKVRKGDGAHHVSGFCMETNGHKVGTVLPPRLPSSERETDASVGTCNGTGRRKRTESSSLIAFSAMARAKLRKAPAFLGPAALQGSTART